MQVLDTVDGSVHVLCDAGAGGCSSCVRGHTQEEWKIIQVYVGDRI
jgi:hypothetical protein